MKNLVFGWIKAGVKYNIKVVSFYENIESLDTWLEKIDFKKLVIVLRTYFDYFSGWWYDSDPYEVVINH